MSVSEHTTRCQCKPIEIGDRFGRLTVIAGPFTVLCPTKRYPDARIKKFECQCDCGSHCSVRDTQMRNGKTKSCGCERREQCRKMATVTNATHGQTRGGICSPEYTAWRAIQTRCYNSSSKDYKRYGGRGIRVCEQWLKSFPAFFQDMGPRPSRFYSIERKENDGPYAPENCRWATAKEQSENRCNTIMLEHSGEAHTVSDWSRLLGIHKATLQHRLKRGWSVEKALSSKPISRRNKP